MRNLIEKLFQTVFEKASTRVILKPFSTTFITAQNQVLVTRTLTSGSSKVVFQEPGHARKDPDELPPYVTTEVPVHIIISDKSVSVHGSVGQDIAMKWVN